jgi:hypothetical protein
VLAVITILFLVGSAVVVLAIEQGRMARNLNETMIARQQAMAGIAEAQALLLNAPDWSKAGVLPPLVPPAQVDPRVPAAYTIAVDGPPVSPPSSKDACIVVAHGWFMNPGPHNDVYIRCSFQRPLGFQFALQTNISGAQVNNPPAAGEYSIADRVPALKGALGTDANVNNQVSAQMLNSIYGNVEVGVGGTASVMTPNGITTIDSASGGTFSNGLNANPIAPTAPTLPTMSPTTFAGASDSGVLPPGYYPSLSIRGNCTMQFQDGGTYVIGSLGFNGAPATLEMPANANGVHVYFESDVDLSGHFLDNGAPGQLLMLGTAGCTHIVLDNSAFKGAGSPTFNGAVYAPAALVDANGLNIIGAILSNNFKNGTIDAEPGSIPVMGVAPVSWIESRQ